MCFTSGRRLTQERLLCLDSLVNSKAVCAKHVPWFNFQLDDPNTSIYITFMTMDSSQQSGLDGDLEMTQ